MFNLSGIFREVRVTSLPLPVHIYDFNWRTYIDNNDQLASIDVELTFHWDHMYHKSLLEVEEEDLSAYINMLEEYYMVEVSIYEEGYLTASVPTSTSHLLMFSNPSKDCVSRSSAYVPVPASSDWTEKASSSTTLKTTLNVYCPELWQAEKPYVYTLVVSLKSVGTAGNSNDADRILSQDSLTLQTESCRLGFRRIEIVDGQLKVNRRPVMIRGVNLHEHDHITGHAIKSTLIEADIQLMKRNNINSIRTSHYPHTPWFYELCTVYGVMVVDESNIETHGMKPYAGRLADDPKWHQVRLYFVYTPYLCIYYLYAYSFSVIYIGFHAAIDKNV